MTDGAPHEEDAPLSAEEASQALRYFLSAVRLEEALTARPRARRSAPGHMQPQLAAPVMAQEYFKLPGDGALNALLLSGTPVTRPLQDDAVGFFETWLTRRYRSGEEDRDATHPLCFPVVHLRRRDVLSGLLRMPVRLRFLDQAGQAFVPPSKADRRMQRYPPPPVAVELRPAPRRSDEWPFLIDAQLLRRQLGVGDEAINALFADLRAMTAASPRAMLARIGQMLAAELAVLQPNTDGSFAPAASDTEPAADPAALLRPMQELIALQGQACRAYPMAIVIDGERSSTTLHLQRDLRQLLETEDSLRATPVLASYVTGRPLPQGGRPQRALFAGRPPLTESQRDAAEACWGSTLSTIQGPPGTGKTTLIQHLCAEFVVRQVEALLDHGTMGTGPLVITSSNNRAVDNALAPMIGQPTDNGEALPLALRAGSREVCERTLVPMLNRVQLVLSGAAMRGMTERTQALAAALHRFQAVRDDLRTRLAPRAKALKTEGERQALLLELRSLGPPPASADALRKNGPLRDACNDVRERLVALAGLAERAPSHKTLAAVNQRFKGLCRKALPRLHETAAAAGRTVSMTLPPPLPPSADPEVLLTIWQDALAEAEQTLDALADELQAAEAARARERRRTKLQADLARLGEPAEMPPAEVPEALGRALFEHALAVRHAWAATEAERLMPLVQRLRAAAAERRSLHQPFRTGQDQQALMRLFGVWGCTLLSLGNCFAAAPGGVAQLVIDEAGQCHPVHAVSGLLRARAALVIGDVHQLAPVFSLTAEDDRRALQQSGVTLPATRLAPYRLHDESDNSTQRLADRAVTRRLSLLDHFRCQKPIIALCDRLCGYGLRLHTPPIDRSGQFPWLRAPLLWLEQPGRQLRLGASWYNPEEAECVFALAAALFGAGLEPEDLAVITPYRGQLDHLRRGFRARGVPLEPSPELRELDDPLPSRTGLATGTVHRFQGGERSIVLLSCVVSQPRSLAFLNARVNLLNVAVSRAQHHLVAIGQQAVLAQGALTQQLVDAASAMTWDAALNRP